MPTAPKKLTKELKNGLQETKDLDIVHKIEKFESDAYELLQEERKEHLKALLKLRPAFKKEIDKVKNYKKKLKIKHNILNAEQELLFLERSLAFQDKTIKGLKKAIKDCD